MTDSIIRICEKIVAIENAFRKNGRTSMYGNNFRVLSLHELDNTAINDVNLSFDAPIIYDNATVYLMAEMILNLTKRTNKFEN